MKPRLNMNTPSPNNLPLFTDQIAQDAIFRHVLALGDTGSGKTRYFLLPYLERLLASHAETPEPRAGAFILDVKGDMVGYVRQILRRIGREEDLVVLGKGGNAWLDPFDFLHRDTRNIAEELIQLTSMIRGVNGRSDDFWIENARRLLTAGAAFSRIRGFGRLESLHAIDDALGELAEARNGYDDEGARGKSLAGFVQMARWAVTSKVLSPEEGRMLVTYLETDLRSLPDGTWGVILNYTRSYLAAILDGRLSQLFTPAENRPHRFRSETVLDAGKVAVISLSSLHFGPMADALRTLLKTGFQRCVLRRYDLRHFDGHNTRPISNRPVYFVADEFAASLTSGRQDIGDPFFLSQAREFRCGCLLATQGISALLAAARDDASVSNLVNNCATKLFLHNTCPETLELSEVLTSGPKGTKPPAAPPYFRLPNCEFERMHSVDGKRDECLPDAHRIIRQMAVGEGLLCRHDGQAFKVRLSCIEGVEWQSP